MRLTQIFHQSLREAPAGEDRPGRQYLLRAGFCARLEHGSQAILPLGQAVLQRLKDSLYQCFELDKGGALVLPEENNFADVIRGRVRSYRQLPAHLHFHSASGSILHVCFISTNGKQSAEQLQTGLDTFFQLCRLPVTLAEHYDDGKEWHTFQVNGQSILMTCPGCGYTATQESARFTHPVPLSEAALPLESVATPHCTSIAALAEFLHISPERTAKAVFLSAEIPGQAPQLIFAVVRGDDEVNEASIRRLSGAAALRPATEDEILSIGAVPGYASPLGVHDALVIVDEAVRTSPNLVAGANREGYHLRNVNYGRDFKANQVAHIALARSGAACPQCARPLQSRESTALAGIHPLHLPDCNYVDENGQLHPVQAAGLWINLYRVLDSLAEAHHDQHGLIWPSAAAFSPLHLIVLNSKTGRSEAVADEFYRRLFDIGCEPLFDDRVESAGVKFTDADLLGLPLRLTISERGLNQETVELKRRATGEVTLLPLSEALNRLQEIIAALT